MTRGHRRKPGTVPLLEAILWGRPNLPDAACTGRHELFDAAVNPKPHHRRAPTARAEAEALCWQCPHRTECKDTLARPRPQKEAS